VSFIRCNAATGKVHHCLGVQEETCTVYTGGGGDYCFASVVTPSEMCNLSSITNKRTNKLRGLDP
jgi:hypothetical protein